MHHVNLVSTVQVAVNLVIASMQMGAIVLLGLVIAAQDGLEDDAMKCALMVFTVMSALKFVGALMEEYATIQMECVHVHPDTEEILAKILVNVSISMKFK